MEPGDPGVKVGDQVVVYPWRVGCESSCGPCKHDAQSYCSSGAAVESIGINTDGGLVFCVYYEELFYALCGTKTAVAF